VVTAAVAAAEVAAATGQGLTFTLPLDSDASSASSAPSTPPTGSPFRASAGVAPPAQPRLLLDTNNPFYSATAASRRRERTRVMRRKAADRAAAGLPPSGRRIAGGSMARSAVVLAGGGAEHEACGSAAPALATASAAGAAAAAAGHDGEGGEQGGATGPAAYGRSARGVAPSVSSPGGGCGCATATVDAEKRIMKKLDAIVKQSIEDRKSDEKVNKVTRQEVTAMAAEMKMVKKRTGKLAKSLDTAQGDIKRASEGLEALNKTLTVAGAGTTGPGLVGVAQAAAANGDTQPDFFSGQPQKATWVKSMVVCW